MSVLKHTMYRTAKHGRDSPECLVNEQFLFTLFIYICFPVQACTKSDFMGPDKFMDIKKDLHSLAAPLGVFLGIRGRSRMLLQCLGPFYVAVFFFFFFLLMKSAVYFICILYIFGFFCV